MSSGDIFPERRLRSRTPEILFMDLQLLLVDRTYVSELFRALFYPKGPESSPSHTHSGLPGFSVCLFVLGLTTATLSPEPLSSHKLRRPPQRRAVIHCEHRSNTSPPFLRSQHYTPPPQPSRQRVPSRLSQAHRTKRQSKMPENKRCSSAAEGGIETGRSPRTGLLS